MASGQEMPGVMGKMGVSESVQEKEKKNRSTTHTYAHTQRHKNQE